MYHLHFNIVVIAGLLSLAYAQSGALQVLLTSGFPSCASDCLLQYLPESTCSVSDLSCLCAAQTLWANTTACALSTCTVQEALTARNISSHICNLPVRDKSLEVELVGPVLCLFALIFVILRVLARQPWKTDMFGADDALIVVAIIFAIPAVVGQIYQGRNGLGRDIWTIPFEHISNVLHLLYVSEIPYLLATVSIRLSILVFYLRVFSMRRTQTIIKIMIIINAAFCIAFFFPLVFQCRPVHYFWTRWSKETTGKCINVNAGSWSFASINMVLDLAVLILPLPTLARLQLTYSWKKRLGIFIMFGSGSVVTIVSILRLRTLIVFANTLNPTWDYLGAAIWSAVELMVGIMCACLPGVRIFFTKVAPEWLGLGSKMDSRGTVTAVSDNHELLNNPRNYSRKITSTQTSSDPGTSLYGRQSQGV